jgi:membrane protein
MNHREWRRTLEDVVAFGRDQNVTTIAAGLAFHALNALVPAVILLLIGLSSLGGFESVTPFVTRLLGFESGALQGVTQQMTNASGGRLRAGVVAGAIFLWSAGRLFEAVQDSFAVVYGTEPYDSWRRKLLGIVLTFATFAVGFVAMGVVGVWLSNLVEGLAWRIASPFLLVVALSVLFVPLYYVLPNVHIDLREAVPGAVLAAFGWTLSAVGFRLYANVSSSVQLYGALGGLVLFMTWVYLGGLVLLLGVVLNAKVADRLDVTETQ